MRSKSLAHFALALAAMNLLAVQPAVAATGTSGCWTYETSETHPSTHEYRPEWAILVSARQWGPPYDWRLDCTHSTDAPCAKGQVVSGVMSSMSFALTPPPNLHAEVTGTPTILVKSEHQVLWYFDIYDSILNLLGRINVNLTNTPTEGCSNKVDIIFPVSDSYKNAHLMIRNAQIH